MTDLLATPDTTEDAARIVAELCAELLERAEDYRMGGSSAEHTADLLCRAENAIARLQARVVEAEADVAHAVDNWTLERDRREDAEARVVEAERQRDEAVERGDDHWRSYVSERSRRGDAEAALLASQERERQAVRETWEKAAEIADERAKAVTRTNLNRRGQASSVGLFGAGVAERIAATLRDAASQDTAGETT